MPAPFRRDLAERPIVGAGAGCSYPGVTTRIAGGAACPAPGGNAAAKPHRCHRTCRFVTGLLAFVGYGARRRIESQIDPGRPRRCTGPKSAAGERVGTG